MAVLATSVYVGGTLYPAGTDSSSMPAGVADEIRTGSAWAGGTAPALTGTDDPGYEHIVAADLSTATKARAALGLGASSVRGGLGVNVEDYLSLSNTTNHLAGFTAALADLKARGGGVLYAPRAQYVLPTPLVFDGHKNITVRGAGRDSTKILCAQQFITAGNSSDSCTVEDLRFECSTATNTFNGIDVDYPRRWTVRNCYGRGFGGDTIRYRGGLQSRTEFNYILAKDSSGTNGHAGISFTATDALGAATTMRSEQDYVGAGVQYGLFVQRCGNSVFINPICEGMQVGLRFEISTHGALIDPYTEATTVEAVQFHDSIIPLIAGRYTVGQGITRTWSGTAFGDRFSARLGRNYVDTGKGLLFGGAAGGSDPDLVPSIRAGSGSPEGVVTGVVGSKWLRTDGAADTVEYRKATGTGNTGWLAAGTGVSGTVIDGARDNSATTISTTDRKMCSTTAAIAAGIPYLQFFTPSQALSVTKVGFCTSTTATTGATLIRFGLYLVNGDGTVSLVAQTANDTTLLGVAGTIYRKAFDTTGGYPASYSLVAGQRYATSLLVVGGTPGNLRGPTAPPAVLLNTPPVLCSTAGAAQSDLPVGPTAISGTGQILVWSEVSV